MGEDVRRGEPAEHEEQYAEPRYAGAGPSWAFGVGVVVSLMTTVWWGMVGLDTENFGSDCLYYFGELGPRTERCQHASDVAREWLPRCVRAAWIGAAVTFVIPSRWPRVRWLAAAWVLACFACALTVGLRAMSLARP